MIVIDRLPFKAHLHPHVIEIMPENTSAGRKLLAAIETAETTTGLVDNSISIAQSIIKFAKDRSQDITPADSSSISSTLECWGAVPHGSLVEYVSAARDAKTKLCEATFSGLGRPLGNSRDAVVSRAAEIQGGGLSGVGGTLLGSVLTAGMIAIDGYLTRRELRRGFQQVDQSLRAGFDQVSNRLSWTTSEITFRQDHQIAQTEEIINILHRPLGTNVDEHRRLGILCYQAGLMTEALEFLEVAAKLGKIDYISETYIGYIYLLGGSREYAKAISSFRDAARHALAFADSREHAIGALCLAARAYYLLAAQDQGNPKAQLASAVAMLDDALKLANQVQPTAVPEIQFQLAQCQVVSGDLEKAESTLSALFATSPGYLVKVVLEDDFLLGKEVIERMLTRIVARVRSSVLELLDRHLVLLDAIGRVWTEDQPATPEGYQARVERAAELVEEGRLASLFSALEILDSIDFPAPVLSKVSVSGKSVGVRAYYESNALSVGGELL